MGGGEKPMKKLVISLSAVVLACSAWVFYSFATEEKSDIFRSLSAELKEIQATKDRYIAQVEHIGITSGEFQTYKAYMRANQQLNNRKDELSDSELLKDLIIEKLLLLEAEKQGVAVSLEQARAYSDEMRHILESTADEKAKAFQQQVIALTGLREDEYWEKHAPEAYKSQLSIEHLLNKLVQDGVLPNASGDPESFQTAWKSYKDKLYESRSEQVKIFIDDIQ